MTRSPKGTDVEPRGDHDLLRLGWFASVASVLCFLSYLQRGEVLLYGDAIAHINIARRVFDSQTPGLLQLGTVWLPLPHLLMIPFLLSKGMWQSGAGGSIPSMVAYVFGVIGIYRLVRGVLERDLRTRPAARIAGWIAAILYGANPNLIYLQATAMTESLYLALFIWAAVFFFAEFLRNGQTDDSRAGTALRRCAWCVAGADLTRYDGWFLAAAIGLWVLILLLRRWDKPRFRRLALKCLLGIAAAPALWLAYNAAIYRNPLEFANGPYSAKAIEERTSTPGTPAHPGAKDVVVAARYFLKAAELNMAQGNWGRFWLAIAAAGLILILMRLRARAALLLLWLPLLFYALSIAYGGVPLFLPSWYPFSWYNTRYGLQLLPLFAASAALIVFEMSQFFAGDKDSTAESRAGRREILRLLLPPAAMVAVIALSYVFIWRAKPLVFTEAWINSRSKLALESAVARAVQSLPPGATYLMYLGDHPGVFQQAGVPFRQVVNEGNHRPWEKPKDPQGLWERALADPAHSVDFVIAYDGDDVDRRVDKNRLTLLSVLHATGQPHARIYAARSAMNH